jgi:hypothetical protein
VFARRNKMGEADLPPELVPEEATR